MGEGAVDEERPQTNEDEVAPKAHPPDKGARDEGGRNDREHHLERHKEERRDIGRKGRRGCADSSQHGVLKSPDKEGVVGTKGDRVPHDDPKYGDDADGYEGLRHRREHVLLSNQPAVEQS